MESIPELELRDEDRPSNDRDQPKAGHHSAGRVESVGEEFRPIHEGETVAALTITVALPYGKLRFLLCGVVSTKREKT